MEQFERQNLEEIILYFDINLCVKFHIIRWKCSEYIRKKNSQGAFLDKTIFIQSFSNHFFNLQFLFVGSYSRQYIIVYSI